MEKVVTWIIENPDAAASFIAIGSTALTVLGGFTGAFLKYLLDKIQLKNARKMRFEEKIGEKIMESLKEILEVEQKAYVIEIYNIEERLKDMDDEIKSFGEDVYYPAIMENWESLAGYAQELNSARALHEIYLGQEVAAYLWYGREYLNALMDFIRRNNMAYNTREMGMFFIFDIMNWREAFEKVIIRDISAHSTKLVEHKGEQWESQKELIKESLYKNSLLYTVLTDDGAEESQMLYSFIEEIKSQKQNYESNLFIKVIKKIRSIFDSGRLSK